MSALGQKRTLPAAEAISASPLCVQPVSAPSRPLPIPDSAGSADRQCPGPPIPGRSSPVGCPELQLIALTRTNGRFENETVPCVDGTCNEYLVCAARSGRGRGL